MKLSTTDPTSFFPHPTVDRITGKPTYLTVQNLKKQLVSNAISVSFLGRRPLD